RTGGGFAEEPTRGDGPVPDLRGPGGAAGSRRHLLRAGILGGAAHARVRHSRGPGRQRTGSGRHGGRARPAHGRVWTGGGSGWRFRPDAHDVGPAIRRAPVGPSGVRGSRDRAGRGSGCSLADPVGPGGTHPGRRGPPLRIAPQFTTCAVSTTNSADSATP